MKLRRARPRGIFREKYWRPRERDGTQARTAATASRRDYVPSWMLSDCRRPDLNNTCTNYGGLPRKEQAIGRKLERRLLCVKGAPRCGGAHSCALAAVARPMRNELHAHATRISNLARASFQSNDRRNEHRLRFEFLRWSGEEVTATSGILGLRLLTPKMSPCSEKPRNSWVNRLFFLRDKMTISNERFEVCVPWSEPQSNF